MRCVNSVSLNLEPSTQLIGICVETQVAGQQGAYLAHMINRGYLVGTGGLDQVGTAFRGKRLAVGVWRLMG